MRLLYQTQQPYIKEIVKAGLDLSNYATKNN